MEMVSKPCQHRFLHPILVHSVIEKKENTGSQVGHTKKNQGMFFRAYLGWSLKDVAQNYIFISISFYLFIATLCAKMSRVNKA